MPLNLPRAFCLVRELCAVLALLAWPRAVTSACSISTATSPCMAVPNSPSLLSSLRSWLDVGRSEGRSDQREGQSCVLVGPRPSSIIEVG
jgi:hypothetical protein